MILFFTYNKNQITLPKVEEDFVIIEKPVMEADSMLIHRINVESEVKSYKLVALSRQLVEEIQYIKTLLSAYYLNTSFAAGVFDGNSNKNILTENLINYRQAIANRKYEEFPNDAISINQISVLPSNILSGLTSKQLLKSCITESYIKELITTGSNFVPSIHNSIGFTSDYDLLMTEMVLKYFKGVESKPQFLDQLSRNGNRLSNDISNFMCNQINKMSVLEQFLYLGLEPRLK